ncbi:MAG TPA: glycosyltransferase family 2 protein [Acidimicrobiales bacterium]|nr:glycosyltransferase family 2 protein [Acidimicrobiales bacterium]
MKLVAVMVVRDEVDILATTIRYHRALVDEVLVVDNGSTDGTVELLTTLAARDPAVRWTSDPGPYRQDVMVSDLARDAHARGADWVLPVDADEFWWTPGDVRRLLTESTAGALACRVENFVQARRVRERAPANLLSMRWRAQVRANEDESPDRVRAGEISFLEMRYPPKFVCRPTADVIVHLGNHHVELIAGELGASDQLTVLHAPLRGRAMLGQRAEAGRRRIADQPDERIGWHLRRVAELEDAGRLEEEWQACSVHEGALDVSGRRHPVVPDERLVRAVAPFVADGRVARRRPGRRRDRPRWLGSRPP